MPLYHRFIKKVCIKLKCSFCFHFGIAVNPDLFLMLVALDLIHHAQT